MGEGGGKKFSAPPPRGDPFKCNSPNVQNDMCDQFHLQEPMRLIKLHMLCDRGLVGKKGDRFVKLALIQSMANSLGDLFFYLFFFLDHRSY